MANDISGVLSAVAAVATLPLGALALLFVSWEVSAVVFVVGWFLLVPLIPIVGEELLPALRERSESAGSESSASGDRADDPLDELKRRYAQGEIDDAEFERRVGNLVETEGVDVDRSVELDHLAERDRDGERGDPDRLRE